MLNPGFGLNFDDLYATAGLVRVDGAFLAHLAAVDASLRGSADRRASRSGRARAPRRIGAPARRRATPRGLHRAVVRDRSRSVDTAGDARTNSRRCSRASARSCSARRSTATSRTSRSAFDGDALRAQLEAKIGVPLAGVPGELAFARAVGRWGQDEAANEADIDLALRYAAWAVQSADGKARHKSGVLFKAPRKLDFMRLVPVEVETRNDVVDVSPAGGPSASPRRFRADRSRDRSRRWPRPGALLHLVPRAAEGFVLLGLAREKARRRLRTAVQEVALRRYAGRLSARREDLRVSQAAHRRLGGGRAGDHLRRQSIGRGHRPSHLQRLHEGLHLPEAGTGRHSAIRNARAQGRPGVALGFRDLFAADALESAERAAPAASRRDRQAGADRRHRAGRVHARPSPAQRRSHGRGHRRLEDRALARGRRRRHRARRACRIRADPRYRSACTSRSTIA